MRRLGGFLGSLTLLLLGGCLYSFTGGGLSPNIRTMAIASFDNQTPSPDIPKELYDQMNRELRRRLGVRDAPADRADAVVRGAIVSYDADVPVSFSSNPNQAISARRRLQMTIDVEIIDQSNGRTLFSNKALREEAEYPERGEAEGRKQAIQKIVEKIVEGVQSNW